MTKTSEEANKALVLEAFDRLFNRAGLQGRRAILVAQLYPAQRSIDMDDTLAFSVLRRASE
jgi:hypothetical protein